MNYLRSIALIVLILTVACSARVHAQTITIRLINAKSGRALTNKSVTVIWCPDCFSQSEVFIGKDGVGHIQVPPGATTISLMSGLKSGKEPYRVPYIDCNASGLNQLQITQAVKKGIVVQNICGQQSLAPSPGEIVFWAIPRPWWQPDLQ